jgi:hypothetical protein
MSRGSFRISNPGIKQLTKWLSWADSTDTGTLSIPDKLGGAPATQSSGGIKPTVTKSNGIGYGTFSTSVLGLPLSSEINDNIRFGVAFWMRLANVVANKTILTVANTAGGASADKLLYLVTGSTLQVRASVVDRRAQIVTLDTNPTFVYLGIDCSKSTEAAQVIMSLNAFAPTVSFNSDTAWPSTLGTPTGNMLIGAGTNTASSGFVGDIGDLYFFNDFLSTKEQVRVMNFRPPF